MHCMLMDLLHGFEVLSTTEETLFNSHSISLYSLERVKPGLAVRSKADETFVIVDRLKQ